VIIGDLLAHRDQLDLSAAAYARALELAPELLPATLGLVYLDLSRYDYAAADECLGALLEAFPAEASVPIARGFYHFQQHQYKEALAQFNQALELNPGSYGARNGIGTVYLYQGECERARSHYQELEAGFPSVVEVQVDQGLVELCDQDPTKALAQFREAAEADPYSSLALVAMGGAYAAQSRWEDSQEANLEALRLSPPRPPSMIAWGAFSETRD